MGLPSNRQDDCVDLTPETVPVDGLLSQAGERYRSTATERSLSSRAMERMQRSILAASTPEEAVVPSPVEGFRQWLRAFSRPVVYGVLGAAAVAAWVLWVNPMRQPAAQMLYNGEQAHTKTGPAIQSVAPGEIVISRNQPGTLLQLGEATQVFLRHNTAVEVSSANVLSLRTGEIWVYHNGKPGDITVLTPQGSVVPIGTVFGVKAGPPSKGEFQVTVMEGRVDVGRRDNVVRVEAKQQLDWAFSAASPTVKSRPVNVPAWTEEVIKAYQGAFFNQYFPSASASK